ncbi:MAG TPA: PPOX class F420-dependent oxidoreductase [Blastocatellia bacterium]|nr:PPOX class F420-dependent oxidoreductase [Blastocatellia bacterium]HMV83325.1 PPOX class F420-dependent oxidoreductase [Blastocatellia bacterium]HMX24225.1 PPOX class F420-dependent oxidoreductase [Blastocatellia bacterium]HMY72367.1 PPOX class F420-dependent oxidoreductase [Blastocatellia bacterium]HMZ16606.1 PPOX class F420-dependent oxidoreductase [Blastocatellia bacterium]
MASAIPDNYVDLFDKKVFAALATLMPNGSPQVTPVWIDYDGENVIFNTAVGRQKDKNLQADGHVALSLVDPDNPYRYLEVRGTVVERTTDGADEHINKMAKKYIGQDVYPFRQPGEVRVIYKIKPERTSSMG